MRSAFHCFLVWCPISKAWDGKWVIPRPSVISTEPERIEDSVQNRSRVFFLFCFFKRFAAQVQPSRPVPRELEKSCFFSSLKTPNRRRRRRRRWRKFTERERLLAGAPPAFQNLFSCGQRPRSQPPGSLTSSRRPSCLSLSHLAANQNART